MRYYTKREIETLRKQLIAYGRRLADKRWKRMVQTFRKDWKGVVVTCDDAADKLLRLNETTRSKRGRRKG